jgi:hypothetical protein
MHVLRVDSRAASTPSPVHAQGASLHDGPFFATPPNVGAPPADAMSLPRLSGALPLYGVSSSSRPTPTDPPVSPAPAASSSSSLARAWREANPVRKATMLLFPVALAAFAFVWFAPEAPAPRARSEAPKASAAPPAPAVSAEPEPVTPRVLGGSTGLAKAPDGGVTLERRAVDAVAAHRLDEAAALYKDLAAAEPKNAAVVAATRVLAPTATAPR